MTAPAPTREAGAARLAPMIVVAFAAVALPAAGCGADDPGAPADPFAAVGRLARGDRVGPCQLTFIAPDRVLTAAHCVVDRRTWRPDHPEELRAVVGGRSFAVLDATLPEERAMSPSGEILDLRHDWAVLRVAADAGPAPRPLPLAGRRAARLAFVLGEPVAKVGVVGPGDGLDARDRATCRIDGLEADGGLLSYRCDGGTGPGLSGSPLLRATGAGFEVIGVMAAKANLGPGGEVGLVAIPPAAD